MKRYSVVGAVLLCTFVGIFLMTLWPQNKPSHKKEILLSKEVTRQIPDIKEIPKEEFANLKKQIKIPKTDKPQLYADIFRSITTPSDMKTSEYSSNYKFEALRTMKKSNVSKRNNFNKRADELNFIERGPANVPGRTRGLIVLEDDPSGSSWLAGSVGGGIWFTDNRGSSWVNRTPDLPNLATTWIARSKSNLNVFYVATGEIFALGGPSGINGDGIFKSIDNGLTFQQIASTANDPRFRNINRLIIDPEDENVIVVATSSFSTIASQAETSYILRSIDGGLTWTENFRSNRDIEQVIANPDDFNIQYAAINVTGVIKSMDAGISWDFASDGLTASGRIELGVSPVDTARLYASVQGSASGSGSDFYMSLNSGTSWSLVNEENNGNGFNFLDGQGFYDNIVLPDPFDVDKVYVGGVDLFVMEIVDGTQFIQNTITSVEEDNTTSFLDFQDFNAPFLRGGLLLGADIAAQDLTSVEIRFGDGLGQRAHRFSIPPNVGSNNNGGPGVPDAEYIYEEYGDIPFEVWDAENNRQLMVSYRDQENNGRWDLTELNDNLREGREYIFIHNLTYDPDSPNSNISQNGGHVFEQMYFIWPISSTGLPIDVMNLPTSSLRISVGDLVVANRSTINISDSRDQYSNNINNNPQTLGVRTQVDLHPDHHNLIAFDINESDSTFRILNANDGGVYFSARSQEPGTTDNSWFFAGNNMNTGQFYSASKRPGFDTYVGGLQDNGTWVSAFNETVNASSSYIRAFFGDGFETIWNTANDSLVLMTAQNNFIAVSTEGAQTGLDNLLLGTFGLTDRGQDGPFVSRLSNSPVNPDVIFAIGRNGVWKNNAFGLGSWELKQIPANWGFTNFHNIDVSLADPSVIWAGGRMDNGGTFHVSNDGGENFSSVPNFQGATLGISSGFATHPTNPNTAFALFSFAGRPKILRTDNLGDDWEDITGFANGNVSSNGFPDVPVYSLLVLPNNPDVIWAGTEIGIVESLDNGETWSLIDTGFPNVLVWQMKVVDDQIVIATHGRGIWTAQLSNVPQQSFIPHIRDVIQGPTRQQSIILTLYESYDQIEFFVDGQSLGMAQGNPNPGTFVFTLTNNLIPTQDSSFELVIDGINNGNRTSSIPFNVEVFGIDIRNSYVNDFNDVAATRDDFVFSGLNVNNSNGFDSPIMESNHPYSDFSESTAQLKKPIIVQSGNFANIQFDQVALTEPAEDLVTVEASTDGVNWTELETGYSAGNEPDWNIEFQRAGAGTETLLREELAFFSSSFQEGDTVFVRFRLVSNPATNGWGWAMDNLRIQDPSSVVTSTLDEISQGTELSVYPNPIKDQVIKGEYIMQDASEILIEVFDLRGNRLLNRKKTDTVIGINTFEINTSGNLSNGVYILKLRTSDNIEITRKFIVE